MYACYIHAFDVCEMCGDQVVRTTLLLYFVGKIPLDKYAPALIYREVNCVGSIKPYIYAVLCIGSRMDGKVALLFVASFGSEHC